MIEITARAGAKSGARAALRASSLDAAYAMRLARVIRADRADRACREGTARMDALERSGDPAKKDR